MFASEELLEGFKAFPFLEKKLVEKYMNLKPISHETSCEHVLIVNKLVEKKFIETFAHKFALLFVFWTLGPICIIAVCALFPTEIDQSFGYILLVLYKNI